MAINWSSLSGIQTPKQGVIATLPGSSEQDDGLGGLLSGLSSFAGALGGLSKQNPNTTDYVGTAPNTISGILGQPNQAGLQGGLQKQTTLGNTNSIFQNAMNQLGQQEGNKTLNSYLQKANPGLDSAQTPWCAGFVGSVLNSSGMKGTGSLAAKSYLKYGRPTETPSQGDIVVFNDLSGNNNPDRGHVGFVQGIDPKTGQVKVLGGNQDNQVSVKSYPMSAVAGFRQPPTGQEVQQFARQNNIQSPTQLAQLTKTINVNDELPHVMSAIAQNESGGAKNPYQSMTPAGKGRHAVGKYQVLDTNIISWTTEALGYPMTAQQFKNNPDAQEAVAKYKIGQYVQKYGPEGAARAWFGGEGSVKGKDNVKDSLGTSVKEYEKNFNRHYLKSRGGQSLLDEGTYGPNKDIPGGSTKPLPPFAPGLPPLRTANNIPANLEKAFNPQTPVQKLTPGEIDAIMQNLPKKAEGIDWNLLLNQIQDQQKQT